jgi:hypothetical protein
MANLADCVFRCGVAAWLGGLRKEPASTDAGRYMRRSPKLEVIIRKMRRALGCGHDLDQVAWQPRRLALQLTGSWQAGRGCWVGWLAIFLGIAPKSLGMSSPVFHTSTARDQLTNTIATNEPD